jgi:hypothetical protein
MTLVDSNVLLDVMTVGQRWANWSERQLDRAAEQGALIINDVIYAEISAWFNEVELLDERLKRNAIMVAPMVRPCAFPGWPNVYSLPRRRGPADRRSSRFLHRRPCGCRRHPASDPRHKTVSHIFSERDADHACLSEQSVATIASLRSPPSKS